MAFELDHVFICTERDAEEAARLIGFGLAEGAPNIHTGQGTANRRFFFANAYLELLWVHNPAKVQSAGIQRTHLWERWRDRASGACPFGVCLRAKGQKTGEELFPNWEYQPPSEALSLHIATNSNVLTEPLLGYLPVGQRPDNYPSATQQPLEHRRELREMTRVELVMAGGRKWSPEMHAVMDAGLVVLRAGSEFIMELVFDRESKGEKADFRPELPLIFRW